MASTYSTDNDVSEKYSHVTIPTEVNVSNFRDDAYSVMNISLRGLYIVPIDSSEVTDTGYLKLIESKMAAGHILIAVASVSEMENVHEYGLLLIKEAEGLLQKLIDQKIILEGAEKETDYSKNVIRPAKIQGSSPDTYGTFDRPMSGIANDEIEGSVDAENYNSLEDIKK